MGASFIVYKQNENIFEHRTKLSETATIFQAEAVAMDTALQWYHYTQPDEDVRIYADAQSVLLAVQQERPTQLIDNIDNKCIDKVKIFWIPSHIGVTGNERADKLANQAAKGHSDSMYLSTPISVSYTKKCAKLLSQKLWEEDWKTQLNSLTPNTKWVQKLFPDLNSFTDIWKYGKLSHTLTSIYTGHCSLAYFQHKIGRSESATCQCGQDIETPEHYIYVPL